MTRNLVARVTTSLALIVLIAAPLLAGANRVSGGASVSGTVSDVNGTTVKILNGLVSIDISGATVVSDQKHGMLTAASITVGTIIDVKGAPGATPGTIVATVVEVHGPKSDGRIRGAIQNVDTANSTITVLGTVISFNSSTVFEGPHGAKATAAANLTVGAAAEVSIAVFQNKLVALEIEVGGH